MERKMRRKGVSKGELVGTFALFVVVCAIWFSLIAGFAALLVLIVKAIIT